MNGERINQSPRVAFIVLKMMRVNLDKKTLQIQYFN